MPVELGSANPWGYDFQRTGSARQNARIPDTTRYIMECIGDLKEREAAFSPEKPHYTGYHRTHSLTLPAQAPSAFTPHLSSCLIT